MAKKTLDPAAESEAAIKKLVEHRRKLIGNLIRGVITNKKIDEVLATQKAIEVVGEVHKQEKKGTYTLDNI